MVKQVVVSNENAIAQHAASSIVLSRSVLHAAWAPAFLPKLGPFSGARAANTLACGESAAVLSIKKCARS